MCVMARLTGDWQRAARYIADRRGELGLTQQQVQAAGGPSPATQSLIEAGTRQSLQAASAGGLEKALKWAPGSIRAILDGGEPSFLGQPSAAEAADAITEERMDAVLREAGVADLTFEEAMARSEEISAEIRSFLDNRGITLSARQARVVETWAKRLEEDLLAAEADDEPHAS